MTVEILFFFSGMGKTKIVPFTQTGSFLLQTRVGVDEAPQLRSDKGDGDLLPPLLYDSDFPHSDIRSEKTKGQRSHTNKSGLNEPVFDHGSWYCSNPQWGWGRWTPGTSRY